MTLCVIVDVHEMSEVGRWRGSLRSWFELAYENSETE